MAITVEAVYENGVLKPAQPLPLTSERGSHFASTRPSAGHVEPLMQWTGSTEAAAFIATSPELDPQEGP